MSELRSERFLRGRSKVAKVGFPLVLTGVWGVPGTPRVLQNDPRCAPRGAGIAFGIGFSKGLSEFR